MNPKYQKVLDRTCYPDLKSLLRPVDIVDIFRNPEHVEEIVDYALAVKAKTIWMQLAVVYAKAAQNAEDAGLQVVMDRCILVDHRRLLE